MRGAAVSSAGGVGEGLYLMALIEGIFTLQSIATVHNLPDRGHNLHCREDHAWQVGHKGIELAARVKLHKSAGVRRGLLADRVTWSGGWLSSFGHCGMKTASSQCMCRRCGQYVALWSLQDCLDASSLSVHGCLSADAASGHHCAVALAACFILGLLLSCSTAGNAAAAIQR